MAWVERQGDRYRVRYRHAGRQVNDAMFADLQAARSRAAELNRLHDAAARLLTPAPPPTLSAWVDVWMPAHTASEATTAKYTSMLRTHILPTFAHHRLDAISRTDVKAFARDLMVDLAPASVRSIVTLLGLILREAMDEHYLLFDPTARLRLREGPAEPHPVATPAQVLAIADRMLDSHMRLLVITAAYTGMRFGELAGLSRHHVHLDRGAIHVAGDTGALHEVSGRRRLGPPKTKAAVRDVHLPPFLIDALDRHLHAHPYDTVFCTPRGRWMWRTTFTRRHWRPACDGHPDRAWQPIITGLRFHDLRHTHRTWMDEDGIPEALKSQRLGHQLPGIRGVYAHVTDTMQNRLVDSLQQRWLESGGHW